jgi:hypothetical protein
MSDSEDVTVVFSKPEAAVLSGLVGLAVAVMSNDKDAAQRFGESLSQSFIADIAHAVLDKVAASLSTPVQTWDEGEGAE